jgi:anti-sigma B factor antagonist
VHLAIDVGRDQNRLVLRLRGELDLASAPTLDREVASLLQSQPTFLVLDLGRVEFIDSAGLRTLLRARQRCHANGCRFSLRHPSGQARRLFELTRTDERLGLEAGLAGGAKR